MNLPGSLFSHSIGISFQLLFVSFHQARRSIFGSGQAKETPAGAGAACDVICDLVSIDVATEPSNEIFAVENDQEEDTRWI